MWQRKPTFRCKTQEPSFTVKFSPDDKVLLSGHFDGTIVGYDANTGANKFEWNVTPREVRGKIPVTSLAFRPGGGKPMLLVGCSNGCVDRWDLRTLERASSIKEEDNEVYAAEYRYDGTMYATAGKDAQLRIYDDQSGEVIHQYCTVGETLNPAASRIYSINFPKDDPNLVICAGWSKAIYIFDMRMDGEIGKNTGVNKAKHEVFGPYITGDALSSCTDFYMTASHRLEKRVELWDRVEIGKSEEIAWPSKNEFLPQCGKFSNDPAGDYIAVGGSSGSGNEGFGKEAAFVYDRKNAKVVVDAQFERGINCCSFANRDNNMVAFGDSDGQVHVFENAKK